MRFLRKNHDTSYWKQDDQTISGSKAPDEAAGYEDVKLSGYASKADEERKIK